MRCDQKESMPAEEYCNADVPVNVSDQINSATKPSSRTRFYKPYVHRTASFAALLAILLVLIGWLEYGYRCLPRGNWNPPLRFNSTEFLSRRWLPPDTSFPTFFNTPIRHARLSEAPLRGDEESGSVLSFVHSGGSNALTGTPPSISCLITVTRDIKFPEPPSKTDVQRAEAAVSPALERGSSYHLGIGSRNDHIGSVTGKTTFAAGGTNACTLGEDIGPQITGLSSNLHWKCKPLLGRPDRSYWFDPHIKTKKPKIGRRATDSITIPSTGELFSPSAMSSERIPLSTSSTPYHSNAPPEPSPKTDLLNPNIQPSATATFETGQGAHLRTSTSSVPSFPVRNPPAESSSLGVSDFAEAPRLRALEDTGAATAPAEMPAASDDSDPNRPDRGLIPFTTARYIMATYIPTLVAVLVRIAVGWLFSSTKMMEPFVALASENGALVKDLFDICYISTDGRFGAFAFFNRHRMMLCTAILYHTVSLLAPFASELFGIAELCYVQDEWMYCGPEMRINHTVGRVLEGLLGFSAVMGIVVWWMHYKAKSGIYQDPSAIASLAALLHNPEVIDDFRRLDSRSSKEEMMKALGIRRYKLGWYRNAEGTERYGIISGNNRPNSDHVQGSCRASVESSPDQSVNRNARARIWHRALLDFILIAATIVLLVLVVVYYKSTNPNASFERFMSSEKFGPRFLMTIIGMIIYGRWQRIEREVTIIEPYRTLARGQAQPESTILLSRNLSPFFTLFTSLYRRNLFVSLIAAISCLAEFLIIILGAIPFNSGTLYQAYLFSTYLSMAILGLMLLGMVGLYVRPRGPSLPRTPDTVAAVWSYLCGSSLLEDMADMSMLSESTRDRLVRKMGRKYTLEERTNMDGTARWTIDYDSQRSSLA